MAWVGRAAAAASCRRHRRLLASVRLPPPAQRRLLTWHPLLCVLCMLCRSAGGWELLDYGDVVVHVMTAEQREYYALEVGRPWLAFLAWLLLG